MSGYTISPQYGFTADEGRRRQGIGATRLLNTMFYGTAIIVLAYSLAFNFLPNNIRIALAALYVLPAYAGFLACTVIGFPRTSSSVVFLAVILLATSLFSAGVQVFFESGEPSAVEFLRDSLGFVLLPFVTCLRSPPGRQTLRFLIVALAITVPASVLFAFTGPVIFLRTERLATITGGIDMDGLHASAYFIGGVCIALDQLWRKGCRPKLLLQGLVAVSAGLVILYGVRTMQVALVYYFLLIFVSKLDFAIRGAGLVMLTVLLPLGIFLAFTFTGVGSDPTYLHAGSGRIGAYLDRYDIFMNRDWVEQIFGTGPGSDSFVGTRTWRYEAKGSHNDFITLIIQNGVIGFLEGVALCGAVLRRVGPQGRAILLPTLVCSMISNGPLMRPAQLPLFALALAISQWPALTIRRTSIGH